MRTGRRIQVTRSVLYLIAPFLFCLSFAQSNQAQAEPGNTPLAQKISADFKAGKLKGLHSVLIIHKGKVLAENYFKGEDQAWGRPLGGKTHHKDSLHDLRSVSKSITSLLYGIALQDGLVPKPDAKLIDQFPQYKARLDKSPQRQKILIRHALTMTMGTAWNENLPYSDPRNSEIAMEQSKDRLFYALSRPMEGEPGTNWTYNGGATTLIGALIRKGTGQSLSQYAVQKLFTPLGITKFEWLGMTKDQPAAASGLRLTLRDLAKIGRLILNKGCWPHKDSTTQIVPAAWLKRSFAPAAQTTHGLRYGYFWWLSDAGAHQKWSWVAAFGNGGQRLAVFPERELIVAVMAGNYNQADAWKLPTRLTYRYALPALEKQ